MRRMLLIALVLLLASCQTEVERNTYELSNRNSMRTPTYVGCLPDGRALFMVKYHPKLDNGDRSVIEDRIYITLDGETTSVQSIQVGKSRQHQSVVYPGTAEKLPDVPNIQCQPGEVV